MIAALNFASFAIGLYLMASIMAYGLGAIHGAVLLLPIIVTAAWTFAMIKISRAVDPILRKSK